MSASNCSLNLPFLFSFFCLLVDSLIPCTNSSSERAKPALPNLHVDLGAHLPREARLLHRLLRGPEAKTSARG